MKIKELKHIMAYNIIVIPTQYNTKMQTTLDKHIFSFPTTENEKIIKLQKTQNKDGSKEYEYYAIYQGKYIKYTIDDNGWYNIVYIKHSVTYVNKLQPDREDFLKTHSDKSKVKQINLTELQTLKKLFTFQEKYNNRMEYLRKYKGLKYNKVTFDDLLKFNDLFKQKTGLKDKDLYSIIYKIGKSLDDEKQRNPYHHSKIDVDIFNFFSCPFDFLTEEEQLISFNTADKICDVLSLTIPFEIKCQKWSFWNIIHKYKSFYVEPRIFYKDFKEFCEKKNEKYEEYKKIIDEVLITIEIRGVCYITTQYLYGFEIELTKQFIDLFLYKECYTISDTELDQDQLIIEFERNESTETKKQFSLEPEQKKR
jgi:hypothetical protein